MLSIQRTHGEALVLDTSDGPISILVAVLPGSRVKLAIDAPRSVRIAREEIAAPYFQQRCDNLFGPKRSNERMQFRAP